MDNTGDEYERKREEQTIKAQVLWDKIQDLSPEDAILAIQKAITEELQPQIDTLAQRKAARAWNHLGFAQALAKSKGEDRQGESIKVIRRALHVHILVSE